MLLLKQTRIKMILFFFDLEQGKGANNYWKRMRNYIHYSTMRIIVFSE